MKIIRAYHILFSELHISEFICSFDRPLKQKVTMMLQKVCVCQTRLIGLVIKLTGVAPTGKPKMAQIRNDLSDTNGVIIYFFK